jgi:hypothetical protein
VGSATDEAAKVRHTTAVQQRASQPQNVVFAASDSLVAAVKEPELDRRQRESAADCKTGEAEPACMTAAAERRTAEVAGVGSGEQVEEVAVTLAAALAYSTNRQGRPAMSFQLPGRASSVGADKAAHAAKQAAAVELALPAPDALDAGDDLAYIRGAIPPAANAAATRTGAARALATARAACMRYTGWLEHAEHVARTAAAVVGARAEPDEPAAAPAVVEEQAVAVVAAAIAAEALRPNHLAMRPSWDTTDHYRPVSEPGQERSSPCWTRTYSTRLAPTCHPQRWRLPQRHPCWASASGLCASAS